MITSTFITPQFPPRTHRAREALDRWSREYDIWRAVDNARGQRTWPDYVFLPLEPASHIMAQHLRARGIRMRPTAEQFIKLSSYLSMFAAWRVTQGIYRYDPALYAELIDTPIDGRIPCEALRRMPAWCVYVETPDMTVPVHGGGEIPLHGVWAWVDHHAAKSRDVLTLGLDTDAHLAIGHVPLVETLDQALAQVEADWRSGIERGNVATPPPPKFAEHARRVYGPILSLLLYLCADDADYVRPEPPRAKRTKTGWRMFPADKWTVWDVGVRLGAALRRAYQEREIEDRAAAAHGERSRPRPHIRRAHWHGYWTGPRDGDRRLIVRWLPPIPVAMRDLDDLPATIRRVAP